MSIQPDYRETIYYSIIQKLSIDPNQMPHYFSTLIREFSQFDENSTKDICIVCNEHNLFEFDKKMYCSNDYEPIIGTKKGEEYIRGVKKIYFDNEGKPKKDHKIIKESPDQTIRRITNFVIDLLEEPNGQKMDLIDIETVMFGVPVDMYFETKHGDVTKMIVIKYLNHIITFINSEVMMLRRDIRFNSLMSAPAIRMG